MKKKQTQINTDGSKTLLNETPGFISVYVLLPEETCEHFMVCYTSALDKLRKGRTDK